MKTSTLFVVGLIVGAFAVFGIRAASLSGAGDAVSPPTDPAVAVPDPHASHDMSDMPDPAGPAPAPAPAPAAEPSGEDAHADHGDRVPENEICPVMGNEVDPTVFVDYEGRRIGFCCPGCDELFLKDPAKYLKKVDAEIAARKGAK